MATNPPFSRRFVGSQPWVQDDFPRTARTALLHLLHDLIGRKYVSGWIDLDRELRRIGRESPEEYDQEDATREARISSEKLLTSLPWAKLFDFCERLHSHLASAVKEWIPFSEDYEIKQEREEVQRYIADELQRIFLEEHLAYSFTQGEVRRRGRSHTRQQIAKAEPTLGDPRLTDAREHYRKAMRYFDNPTEPDYENSVKEAVCAVEAAARRLFPETKAKTLGEITNKIRGNQEGQIPKTLADTITGLYAYRNSGDGVAHGGTDGGKATRAIAEYALALAASQIILLHETALAAEAEAPF